MCGSSPPLQLPLVLSSTDSGNLVADMSTILYSQRVIWISGPIDQNTGTAIATQLLILETQSNEEIIMLINSPGGDLHGGLFCIIDAMNACKSPIRTICLGEAQSSGACILSNGTKGLRFAAQNSIVMIHDIQVGRFGSQSVTDFNEEYKHLNCWNDKIISLLAKNCDKKKSDIKDYVNNETSFSAKEAKDFGLVDDILKKWPTI